MPQRHLSLWTAVAERSGDTALESFPIFNISPALTPEELVERVQTNESGVAPQGLAAAVQRLSRRRGF